MRGTAEIVPLHRVVPAPGSWRSASAAPLRGPAHGDLALAPSLHPGVPLIGRERELGELRAALEAALAGSGRTVLLCGEPGIGKTRLASAVAAEAGVRGVPVWWGRSWEEGSAPAFWPWNTALRRFLDRVGDEAVLSELGSWGAELAHVFPVLRERVPNLPPSGGWDSERARFRLFDVVSRFLASVARRSGLVLVLDDIHWADLPTLKLLEFVAADMADARLLVVATYRDTEVRPAAPLLATLSRLAREPSTRRLSVPGLSLAHCARWIRLTELRVDTDALAEMLHRETNGNPFFVGEFVQLLSGEDESPPPSELRVPQSVREVIAKRLDRLGDDCRAILAVAALVGGPVDVGLLTDVLAGPEIEDALERAVGDRILAASETCPGRYVFAHALIRRVLVDELAPSIRAAWHARIAAVLERHATASQLVTTELVRHLAAAGTPSALRKAFDYACRGAEQAALGLGWEEAVRLYEVALEVGRLSGFLDRERSIELELALARALRGSGDVPAARARCEGVIAACRRTPNPEVFARAALIYAGPLPEWGRMEPGGRAILEEACRTSAALEDALRARLCARLAGDIIAANEVQQGPRVFALCADAAAAARRADAPGPLAIALTGTYYAAAMGMRPDGAMPTLPSPDEILAAAEAGGEHAFAAAIRHGRAMTLLAIGEREAFAAEVDGVAATAAASRVPEALWSADALAALRDTVRGRFERAHEALERALATGRRMQLSNAVGVHVSQRIMWHAFQGRLAEIAPELEAFVEEHPGGAGWRPFRALARLACGDAVAARTELQAMLADGLAPARRGAMARCYLGGLAALCVALRDREHAPTLYDHLVRRDDAWCVDGFHTLGPWALLRGGLARLCGRHEEAARHLEDAIRQGWRMGSRPVVARAQSMLASLRHSMQLPADQRERTAALLAEAAHAAQELGLVDVAARVERLRAKADQGARDAGASAFRCEGDVWTVRHAGREVRLKDGKGPRYLATLLATPRREIHVLQFVAPPAAAAAPGATDGLSMGAPGGGIEAAPDERARREYRARLDELRADLDEAEQMGDAGRAERLREELDQLVAQLAGIFAGRAARSGPAETARKAVTKVLRTQIGKLLDMHPDLGRHLRDTVRMGTVCVYAPADPIDWDVCFSPAGRTAAN